MSNPFIPLATQALNANLSKNELRLFLALTIQTLGYHKDADPLTDKRLAKMTGVRVDHLRPCIERFMHYGLFERYPHPYYDYQYHICADFLDEDKVYPPTFPRDREITPPCSVSLPNDGVESPPCSVDSPHDGAESPPCSVDFPNDGGHTTENLNNKKTQQQKTTTGTETEKNVCQKKPQQQKNTTEKKETLITQAQPQTPVTVSMTGFDQLPEQLIIESSQPIRLEIGTKNSGQVDKKSTESTTASIPCSNTEIQSATLQHCFNDAGASGYVFPRWNVGTSDVAVSTPSPVAPTVAVSTPSPVAPTTEPTTEIAKPVAKPREPSLLTRNSQPIADLAVSVANSLIKPNDHSDNNEKPFVVVDEKEVKKTAAKPTANKIPKAVGEENFKACQRHFHPLNAQQQKEVLAVFYHNLKTSKINSKVGYFISLCQKVISPQGLTVPREASVKKDPTPEQLALDKKADAAREQRSVLWGDYQWIKRNAEAFKKTELETAQMMGMEEAYAMFG